MAKKNKKAAYVAWRPNFRNEDTLPDTKVIRTDFLLNFIALSAAIGLTVMLAYKEYNTYSLRSELAGLEELIVENNANNRVILQQHAKFKRTELVLKEVLDFAKQPVLYSELLDLMAEIRPESVTLSSITIRPVATIQGRQKSVDYRITLNGTLSDQASPSPTTVITTYQETLSRAELINPYFKDIALSKFVRDTENSIFNFTIDLSLSQEPAKK